MIWWIDDYRRTDIVPTAKSLSKICNLIQNCPQHWFVGISANKKYSSLNTFKKVFEYFILQCIHVRVQNTQKKYSEYKYSNTFTRVRPSLLAVYTTTVVQVTVIPVVICNIGNSTVPTQKSILVRHYRVHCTVRMTLRQLPISRTLYTVQY